jgi:hypothetical protein
MGMPANRLNKQLKRYAKSIASECVRRTFLEDLHAGKGARTQTGDYSDVKVVTYEREIPWNELARITDEEMKRLMKEVVDRIYTVLVNLENPEFIAKLNDIGDKWTAKWDEPELVPDFILRADRHVNKWPVPGPELKKPSE